MTTSGRHGVFSGAFQKYFDPIILCAVKELLHPSPKITAFDNK